MFALSTGRLDNVSTFSESGVTARVNFSWTTEDRGSSAIDLETPNAQESGTLQDIASV